MLVNYFLPLLILAVTYSRVGVELWGSRAIGENTVKQAESVRNKRRVSMVGELDGGVENLNVMMGD